MGVQAISSLVHNARNLPRGRGFVLWALLVFAFWGVAPCVQAEAVDIYVSPGEHDDRLHINQDATSIWDSMEEAADYFHTRQRGTLVLAIGPEFKELTRNELGDRSVFNAAPAISDAQLLLRSDRCLYCIGKDRS